MTVGDFKKLSEKTFARSLAKTTPAERHWRTFKTALVVKENAPVLSVDVCEQSGDFAVAAAFKVDTFSARTFAPKKSFSMGKSHATAVAFRPDGRVLAAGDASGVVRVFDAASKTVLRELRGDADAAALRSVAFAANRVDVWAGGDDCCVRLWDVATGTAVRSMAAAHADYVRSVALLPASGGVVASGGYDHAIRLWDARTPTPIASFDAAAPVEAVCAFPSGTLLASAGANVITIWDVVARRPLAEIRSHQKAVLALAFDVTTHTLLAGSLDRAVKVHDAESFGVVHSVKYPFPVISLAMAAAGDAMLVGSSTGAFSIRSRKPAVDPSAADVDPKAFAVKPLAQSCSIGASSAASFALQNDVLVAGDDKKRFVKIDRLLRRFLHRQALVYALKGNSPPAVVTLLDELLRRDALAAAIAAADEDVVVSLLRFSCAHVRNTAYAQTLLDAVRVVLASGCCEVGVSAPIDRLVVRLLRVLREEAAFQAQLMRTMGALDMLLTV